MSIASFGMYRAIQRFRPTVMEPIAGAEDVEECWRRRDGASIQDYDGPWAPGDERLCAALRVIQLIQFATQFGNLVIRPMDEGQQDHEESAFLD